MKTWAEIMTLELIHLIQEFPVIWDPSLKSEKDSKSQAWDTIQQRFSVECSEEDLKKKYHSLMASYKDNLKKILEDRCYEPTWFAFRKMNDFLGKIYFPIVQRQLRKTSVKDLKISKIPLSKAKGETPSKKIVKNKTKTDTRAKVMVKADEYTVYCNLLAKKMLKLKEHDRLMLRHEIDNLVFKYEIKGANFK